MTVRVRVFGERHHIPRKEPPVRAATLRADMMKPLPKHRQFTKKRRKALVRRFLAGVSALVSVLTLVKLVVELVIMLLH
jgi:hypothetical protein